MRLTTEHVYVGVPRERLFGYLTDLTTVRDWQPDLAEPPEALTTGGVRPGARWHATVDEPRRGRFTLEVTVAAMTRPEQVSYYMEEPSSSATIAYHLTAQGTGTQVQIQAEFQLKGWRRLLSPLVRPIIQKKLAARLLLLRDAAQAHCQ